MTRDWQAWHDAYDDPASPLSRRLRIVQDEIAAWLDARGALPSRVVSACAGQGRDLLPVLAARPGANVSARLVELDPGTAAVARDHAGPGVEVVTGDAGCVAAYLGAVPADLALMCGVFGNIADDDVRATVATLPQLCAAGATVIWTRSRRAPDLTPAIRAWFAETGFEERAFHAPDGVLFSVGVHRFGGTPAEPEPGRRMFSDSANPSSPVPPHHGRNPD